MSVIVAWKAVVIWACILALAVANGILRELALAPWLGEPAALVISGILLSALILGVAYVSLPWLETRKPAALFAIGLGWLALTLVFEVSFGHWQGKSWPDIAAMYTVKDGNLWLVVLATTALAPYLAARLRRWH